MNTTESPSDSTSLDRSTSDTQTLETLCDQLDHLTERVGELEATVERKDGRIEDLESTVKRQDALLEAPRRKAGGTREMLTEFQSRVLEKNAHLRWEHVEPNVETLEVDTDRVEEFTKDDGEIYACIPGGEDPLNRGGEPALTTGELAPDPATRPDGRGYAPLCSVLEARAACRRGLARSRTSTEYALEPGLQRRSRVR